MSWSLLDQAAIALGMFLFHLLLARWMSPADYGLFSILFVLLFFLQGCQTALVTEPMSVLGPARHADHTAAYLRTVLRLNTVLSASLAVLLALAGAVAVGLGSASGGALLALAAAVPGYFLLSLLRRACYLRWSPGSAFALSVTHSGLLLGGLIVLARWRAPSPATACLLFAAAALLGALMFVLTPARLRDPAPALESRRVVAESWEYGRWILVANVAHWLGTGLYVPLVGSIAGLAEAGTFRALQNVVAPVQQLLFSLSMLLLPWLAAQRRRGDDLRQRLTWLWGCTLPPVVLYGVLVVAFGRPLLALLYRQESYVQSFRLLVGFAAFAVMIAVVHALSLSLRSIERTTAIFRSKVGAMAFSLTVGLGLTWFAGLPGAVAGMVLAAAVEAAVLALAFPWRGGDG